jgi:hypothetical protein
MTLIREHLEKGKGTNNSNDTGRDNLGGTSSDGSGSGGRSTSASTRGDDRRGVSTRRLGTSTGGTSRRTVAGSGLNERTVLVEGSIAKALGVLSSAGGLVRTSSDAASIELVSAHLSTVLSLSRGGRSSGRSVASRDNGGSGGVVDTSDGDGARLGDGDGLVAVGESGLLGAVGGQLGDNLGGVSRTSGLRTLVASSGLLELATLPGVVAEASSVLSGALSHVGIGSNAALIELVGAHLSAVASVSRLGRSIASSGGNGLGDGARAVLNGEGSGLGDSVSLVTVGEGGSTRAVGGQVSDDLGGVVNGLVRRRSIVRRSVGSAEKGGSESGSLDETHFF